jgi:hypothetical protein
VSATWQMWKHLVSSTRMSGALLEAWRIAERRRRAHADSGEGRRRSTVFTETTLVQVCCSRRPVERRAPQAIYHFVLDRV